MGSGEKTILERFSGEYYQLTASERKVADYVAAHQWETRLMPISELAEACGVAEATVSRFCRRLGYSGYNAFKLAVAGAAAAARRSGEPFLSGEVSDEDSIPDLCRKLYAAEVEAMTQTLELTAPENIQAAADVLVNAGRVFCMGQGGSMIMAEEAAHLFSTGMSGFAAVSDSHRQVIAAATMSPGDAVLFFSYSGATKDIIDLFSVVRERQGRVVLITHFPGSPAAALADVVLQCGANEGPLQLGSIPARMAQLFLIDILFTEVCRRDPDPVKAVRGRVAAALAPKHM